MSNKLTAVIDIDTIIIHAALAAQESYITAIHKPTGRTKEFATQTDFFGHWSKKDGGWLAAKNKEQLEKGLEPFNVEDFEIQKGCRLVSSDGISPEVIAKGRFKSKIENILNLDWCGDIKICFGTGVNFRYELAQLQPYKSERPEKPLLYEVVRDYMLSRYKSKIVSAEGVESDDIIVSLLYQDWVKAKKNHSYLSTVGVFCDKDIAQVPCLHYNFNKPEEGVRKITPLDAAKNFGKQCMMGDAIDTIPGLHSLTEGLCKKYGVRKSNGVGAKTADSFLNGADTPQEVFERVVEAYRDYYGEERHLMMSFRGEPLEWDWLDHLNERFQLLKMRADYTKPNPHVRGFLGKLGVSIDKQEG